MNVTLTREHEELIKRKLASGRYASPSDVVSDALRLLEERDRAHAAGLTALRAEIQKGIDSGPPIPAADVRRQLRRFIANQPKQKAKSPA